jgi:hypothetical protein
MMRDACSVLAMWCTKKTSAPIPASASTMPSTTASDGTKRTSSTLRMVRSTTTQYANTPTNVPSTICVARSRMKVRRMRGVNWLEACVTASIVSEKVSPATVMIELAMADRSERELSALAPKTRGKRASASASTRAETSTMSTASATPPRPMAPGTNQSVPRRRAQAARSLTSMMTRGWRTTRAAAMNDLVVAVALGSTRASVLTSTSVAFTQGVLAVVTLIGLQYVVAWLSVRVGAVRRAVRAEPSLLVHRSAGSGEGPGGTIPPRPAQGG